MRTWTVGLAAAAMGALALTLLGSFGRELLLSAIVVPAVLFTVALVSAELGRSRGGSLLSALLGPAVVLLALGLTHPFLLRLDAPSDRDHVVHVAKAAWMLADLLPRGQLIGWSDAADFGWPLNALYPPGASVLPALLRVATFGALPWDQVYALALLLVVSVTALAHYAFALRPLGRAGATVAALVSLATPGGWFQGGYIFEMATGVWGTSLAFGLTLLSLACLPRAMRGSWSFTVGSGVLGAAALLTHPAAVMVGVTLGLARFAQLVLSGDGEEGPSGSRGVVRGLIAAALAFGLSAWWWLPFGAHAADYANSNGEGWAPLAELVEGLLTGSTLRGVPGAWVGLGLAGLGVLIFRRQSLGIALLAALVLSLVLGSNESLTALRLGRLVGAYDDLQLERFAYVMRGVLWLGVGALVSSAVTAVRATGRPFVVGWVAAAAAVGLLVLPVGARWVAKPELPPFGPPPTASTDPRVAAYRQIAEFMVKERDRSPFFRVALTVKEPWDHTSLWIAAFARGLPVSRLSFHAAEGFRYDFSSMEPGVLRAQDVRYVVGQATSPPAGEGFTRVGLFGPFAVWEWAGYRPNQRAHLVGADGVELQGGVEIIRADLDEVRVKVQAAPPGSRLVFHRAPYPTHRVSRDGQRVRWEPWRVGKRERSSVIAVEAMPGEYVLTERAGGVEWLGWVLTSLSALLAAVLVAARRRPWLEALERRASPTLLKGVAATVALGVVLLALKSFGVTVGRFDARARLADAAVHLGDADCPWSGAEEGFACGAQAWQHPHRARIFNEDRGLSCLWVHPSPGQVLTLSWPKVRYGPRLQVEHGLAANAAGNDPARTVQLAFELGGRIKQTVVQEDLEGWRRETIDTSALEGTTGPLTLQVSAPVIDLRHVCINVRVLDD